jgi:putative ubiquitin-RnfH superfamily antitoxin RatB of RatAB toxin-antitoxin module
MIRVSVAVALPDRQDVSEHELEDDSTVAQAIERAAVAARYPQLDLATVKVGIWSRPCQRDARLRDGDRVEIYRPLQADPKEMRRERARRGKPGLP